MTINQNIYPSTIVPLGYVFILRTLIESDEPHTTQPTNFGLSDTNEFARRDRLYPSTKGRCSEKKKKFYKNPFEVTYRASSLIAPVLMDLSFLLLFFSASIFLSLSSTRQCPNPLSSLTPTLLRSSLLAR